ncbi:MAG: hypothetical protein A2176_01990 [Spirochaetes bacterium RBG_13_51_14]|nr:MAG: hypothetical protein A2176_01990 [Spirochaetes bacterium RBG_13_51_14]
MIKVGFGSGITSLCAQQNRIFIATDAGKIICYDFKDDEVLWEYAVYDTLAGDMAVENDSIYLFGRKGRVHRISSSGVLIWSRDLGNPIMKLPSEDSASYYIPSDETLFVIDKVTGTITWALLMPRITSGNVAVSHGAIYFGTEKDGLSSLKK